MKKLMRPKSEQNNNNIVLENNKKSRSFQFTKFLYRKYKKKKGVSLCDNVVQGISFRVKYKWIGICLFKKGMSNYERVEPELRVG